MRERFGQNDPRLIHSQKELTTLHDLQNRFIQLTQGELNESKKAEIARLRGKISAATAFKPPTGSPEPTSDKSAVMQQLRQLQEQFAQQQKQLAEREKQYATMLVEQRQPPLPSLENGTVKIYRFAYSNANDAAKTVESLFGTQSLRVSVDQRNNLLVAYGKPDVITALDALLNRLDEQASPDGYQKSTKGTASPRSLMLRVFWLADSMPTTVGQDPAEFLPKSVLDATKKLGLEAPRLVTQTVTSLATGKEDAVDFSTNVPALLLGDAVAMVCEGKLKLVADDRVRLDMGVHVNGQTMTCDMRGSMATPLRHYMVLGTASSITWGWQHLSTNRHGRLGPYANGEPGRRFRTDRGTCDWSRGGPRISRSGGSRRHGSWR